MSEFTTLADRITPASDRDRRLTKLIERSRGSILKAAATEKKVTIRLKEMTR